MKIYKVCVPVDYIIGYLRYGHAEFTIAAESAEEAIKKLQENKETCEKMDTGEIPNDPDFVEFERDSLIIDDYGIEDFGDFRYEDAYIDEEE